LVLLVVVAALVVYNLVISRSRQRKRDIIAAVLVDFLPRTWDPLHGVTVAWKSFRSDPQRVTVTYPPEVPDRDPKWKSDLVDTIAYRSGMEAWKVAWDPAKLRVVVTAKKPDVVAPPTEEERNRAVILTRTHMVIGTLFASDIKLSIPSWSADSTDPPGGFPLEIDIAYEPTTRDTSTQWRRRLEAVTALKVPPGNARWVAQYKAAADEIVLKHRPALPTKLTHPGPSLWQNGDAGIILPYAMEETGNLAVWAITGVASKSRPTVHTLIIGPTGTGKTSVMRALLTAGTGQGVYVLACDPKRIELTPFRGWPGVLAVGSTEQDMAMVIKATYDLMMARYSLIEAGQADADDMTPVLLFLDELLILQARLNRWWNQNKGPETEEVWGTKTGTAHPAMGLIAELLALARSANIRLIEGVQRPDAELFEKGARDNLRHRIGLGRLSSQGAEMLWGDSFTGTDTPMISGRAVASPDGSTPLEVQMYWVPDPRARSEEDAALIMALRQAAAIAFQNKQAPDGLDLSAVSDAAKTIPEGDIGQAETTQAEVGEVTDHTEVLSTQTVAAASLVVGDRIVDDDGLMWQVADAEEAENPDDPDQWDYMSITLTGPAGQRSYEAPGDSTFERVIET